MGHLSSEDVLNMGIFQAATLVYWRVRTFPFGVRKIVAMFSGTSSGAPWPALILGFKDPHLSNEKNPGCLGCIGDYTTPCYMVYYIPL